MRSCIAQCMAKADWYPRSALDAVWHLISNTRMIYDLQIKVIAMSCAQMALSQDQAVRTYRRLTLRHTAGK